MGKWRRKRTLGSLSMLCLIMAIASSILSGRTEAEPNSSPPAANAPVYVIPVHQTIESGLQSFMERAWKEARNARAAAIVLDIDTFGGRVDAAEAIGTLVQESSIPTVAFIHGKAVSAGSYIALSAGSIVMQPGSTIGSAAVVDATGTEIESPKVVSHWASEMKAAAQIHGRNADIAEGMVDKNIKVDMPQIHRTKEKGQIISLTAEEAVKVGYAEKICRDRQELLAFMGMQDRPVVTVQPSLAERLSRWITDPVVSTILLLVGIAGVAIELFIPGFGLPGILGVAGFGLYFFGHYIAGFAGIEDILLFVIGVVLLVIEVFVSSFGILGIAGIACLFSGVVLAAYNTKQAALSLGLACLVAAVIVGIAIRYFGHKGVWNRFVLKEQLSTEKGYISNPDMSYLLGQKGTALTPLRPAGAAMIGDQRIDVVTRGEFIDRNRPIAVIQIEGTRVVVKEDLSKEE